MSRTGRGNVEHDSASRVKSLTSNLPEGVSNALSKVREANEESIREPRPVPEGLRDLVLFGSVSEELSFGNFTFKLSTLSSKKQREILKKLIPLSNDEKLVNLKFLALSQAIVSVNNVPLESLYFGEDPDLTIDQKKIEVLSELQSTLIDKLFEKYEDLVKKSNSMFKDGGIEESIKN